MDKADYINNFGALFPCPNRPEIYDESIADGVTSVIHSKSQAIHRAHITDWDSFQAAERESRSFVIDSFDEACYSELCELVTFYAQVMTRQMIEHLQGICVGNHALTYWTSKKNESHAHRA